jgi:hypothetical protein
MVDNIAKIKEIIEEHQTIKGHVKLVGDSITDQEALLSLQSVRPEWIPGRLEILSHKQNKLEQTISFLAEGLKNHFAKEKEVLPSVLGEFLMRALLLEHKEIGESISKIKSMVTGTELEGLSRDELMAREAEIQQQVISLSGTIEEHASKEEQMLEMVQRALEEKE